MYKLRTMDFMLSQEELSRRNARRKRNREAAARCRERRMETVKELENKVKALQMERDQLKKNNEEMAYDLDKCKFQVSAKSDFLNLEKFQDNDENNNDTNLTSLLNIWTNVWIQKLKMMSTNNGNEIDSPQSTKSLHSPMTPKEHFHYDSFSDPGLTPLLDGRVKFEFPDLPEESTRKARMASTSEFNKFLDEF